MVTDSKTLKENAQTLIEKDSRAKKILQKANGERHYKEISELLGVHEKTVSPILSLAKELGFAERIKAGVYKKITSHMKYIPTSKTKNKQETSLAKKVLKKTEKIKNTPKFIGNLPKSISGGNKFLSLINKMKDTYEILYLTENFLRELIRKVLGQYPNWWKQKVPSGVKTSVQNEMNKSKYNDAPKIDELEYTHLGDLNQIILKNWKDFEPFLKVKDKPQFSAKLVEAIPMRNAIGHCIPLRAGDDQNYAVMRFKDILKMFN